MDVTNMNLHDEINSESFSVLKVPTGWVYTLKQNNRGFLNSVFVPDHSTLESTLNAVTFTADVDITSGGL